MTLDFQGGEGLVDNLAGSQGGGLPRWHNLKHKQRVESRSQEIQKSRNLEIWKVLHLEEASLLLSPNGILPDAEKAPVVLRRLWKELELRPVGRVQLRVTFKLRLLLQNIFTPEFEISHLLG